jgi:phosphoribosylformimino-5-aminoimidazole carboxamide ribotide isomerase
MRIILAIDILEGKCVRLTKGDYSTNKIYNEDPLEVAMEVEDGGINYLHVVDLDGAKNKKPVNLKILEKLATRTRLRIDFGGGVRTYEDVRSVFNAGARQFTAGSIAVSDRELFLKWLNEFGPEKIILGADFRNGKISTGAWLNDSDSELQTFLKDYADNGVKYALCTDIEKDGMLQGPATEMYRKILGDLELNLIASGGISSVKDVEDVSEAGCEGVIIGKAFYEGRITLKDLRKLC